MIPNEILFILLGLNRIFEDSYRILEGLRTNPNHSIGFERNPRRIR